MSEKSGVAKGPRKGSWRALIHHKRQRYHLGYYSSPEAAHLAYAEARLRLLETEMGTPLIPLVVNAKLRSAIRCDRFAKLFPLF